MTSEFYKMFPTELVPFLLDVFINNEELPSSLCQGFLIPKPQKDVLMLDNWHLITFLNTNYRLILDILVLHKSFILKAFDSIELQFMFKALDLFWFGEHFKKSTCTLYAFGNNLIELLYQTLKRFRMDREMRQVPGLSHLPIFIFTSHANVKSSSNGISTG